MDFIQEKKIKTSDVLSTFSTEASILLAYNLSRYYILFK